MQPPDSEPDSAPLSNDPAAKSFEGLLSISGSTVDPGRVARRRMQAQKSKQSDQSPARTRWSGAGPSERDPQAVGSVFERVARQNGWDEELRRGSIFGQWDKIVGELNASKSQPLSLRGGVLTIAAESTTWATQLRLMLPHLHQAINKFVGPDVVLSIRIQGPAAPSWKKGLRSMRGRGPRDTYG